MVYHHFAPPFRIAFYFFQGFFTNPRRCLQFSKGLALFDASMGFSMVRNDRTCTWCATMFGYVLYLRSYLGRISHLTRLFSPLKPPAIAVYDVELCIYTSWKTVLKRDGSWMYTGYENGPLVVEMRSESRNTYRTKKQSFPKIRSQDVVILWPFRFYGFRPSFCNLAPQKCCNSIMSFLGGCTANH